jgi:hypothetical protein
MMQKSHAKTPRRKEKNTRTGLTGLAGFFLCGIYPVHLVHPVKNSLRLCGFA